MTHLPSHPHRITAALLTVLLPIVAAGSASSLAPSDSAATSAAPPPVVELLSRGTVAKRFKVKAHRIELKAKRKIDVAVAHLTFEPGGATGWHTHGGPTTVTVIAGSTTITNRHCKSKTYTVGQTFVERGPDRHMATNPGDTTLETIVTFFVPTGSALTTPATPPACAR